MPLQTQCASHPERIASGLCTSCRRAVCNECSTRIEGINVCATCLAARAAREATRRKRRLAGDAWRSALGPFFGFAALTGVVFLYALAFRLLF